PLFGLRGREAAGEPVVLRRGPGPALDAAVGLEPGDRGDEVPAGDVELRRERTAVLVERRLLGDRGAAGRTADGDAHERTRPAAELTLDDRGVVHDRTLVVAQWCFRQVEMPRTMKSCSPGFTSPSRRASRTSCPPEPTWAIRRFSRAFSSRSARTSAVLACSSRCVRR